MEAVDTSPHTVARRVRAGAHLTPTQGWMNDPYGVRWDGRRYHLYYQAVPEQTTWSPRCVWGHAVSEDLRTWTQQPAVLLPHPGEVGCWSGCTVEDADGAVLAFYTSVSAPDLDIGRIAVARWADGGGAERFTSGPEDVVIAAPPAGLAITAFRDPYVWRVPGGWRMIVGAGTSDGAGRVLQYRSEDLRTWRFDGTLCHGRVDSGGAVDGDGPSTGRQVWECPQIMQVGDGWILIVSVQNDGRAGHVAAASGRYDGTTFVPEHWQRLAHGSAPYATSAFRDRDARPRVISWLQEDPRFTPGPGDWAGAQSLVAELGVGSTGRVTVAPLPDLARSTAFTHHRPIAHPCVHDVSGLDAAGATHVDVAGGPVDVELRRGTQRLVRVSRAEGAAEILIERLGQPAADLPGADPSSAIDVYFDADILEVYSGGAYGAWRLLPNP